MPTETEILNLIKKLVPNSKKYLSDDAAIIPTEKKKLVITTDTLVENVHFIRLDNGVHKTIEPIARNSYSPKEIGWKSLAVNLSDIASMGGKPLYALVSLTLPKNIKKTYIKNLYTGIQNCAKKYKTQIIGGNLTRGKELSITITIIGEVKKNIGKRSSAKPGDIVFVTGTFGDSALALKTMETIETIKTIETIIKKHKTPIPRIEIGQKLSHLTKRLALMDSSDGLSDCLIQISNESKVKIVIEENKIPISTAAENICSKLKTNPYNFALYGGEDYELVGTCSIKDWKKIKEIKAIKIIGHVEKGSGAFLKSKNNRIKRLNTEHSYKHFD